MPDRKGEAASFTHLTNLADPQGLYALVQDYLTWMRVKNYARATVNNREFYLLWFLDWAGQRGLMRPTEITKPILERYQRYLFYYRKKDGGPLSTMCQYNRIVAVRTWFKWLAKGNHILYNPASDLELPKLEKRLPRAVLTEAEAERVLRQPDVTTTLGLRDRAMLETLYSTGIRRLELVNLQVQDMDTGRGTLLVRLGKGRKDRMIPVGERAVLWTENYLNEARPALARGGDEGVLFLSRYGQAMGKDRLTTIVRGYVEAARIKKQGSCHLFRHTMATLMLENGADVRFIQAMLGHAELSTTEIYTQVSIRKLKEVHTLTHPAKARRKETAPVTADGAGPGPTAEDVLEALAVETAADPE